jgi:hypothetical protein
MERLTRASPARPVAARSKNIEPPAAPARHKPKAILKAGNYSGLVLLQSFTAAEARRKAAIHAARASHALLVIELGLIRT